MLTGCSQKYTDPKIYYENRELPLPTISSFPHCLNYGCQKVKIVKLNELEWKQVEKFYGNKANSPQEERNKISKTIGFLEQLVGKKMGTDKDKYGTFQKICIGQQDCVDESTNTTTYLMLMQQRDLIKYHDIASPVVRIPMRWPHQTAVIIDRTTKQMYAVDSWFHDNGFPAETLSLKKWKEGWTPQTHMQRESDL